MEWALLRGLAPEESRRILRRAQRRRFARHEVVFHEGDPGDSVHLVANGRVAIRMTTPLGEVATVNIVGAGAAFGELALIVDDARRSATAVALEPTETLSLRRDAFEEAVAADPAVLRFLVHALADRVRQLSADLLEAMYVPAETRVLRRLAALARLYPATTGGAVVIPLTQDDVASLAGVSRPTTNRVLRAAEERGVVALGRGRITVTDPDALGAAR